MAQKGQIGQASERKHELVAQLASSRLSITHSKKAMQEKLRPGRLVRGVFTRRPKAMFAGSVLTSLIATLLIKRPKKAKKASTPKTNKQILLTWLLSLIKPAAKAWLVHFAKQLAANRLANASRPQGEQSSIKRQDQFFVQR